MDVEPLKVWQADAPQPLEHGKNADAVSVRSAPPRRPVRLRFILPVSLLLLLLLAIAGEMLTGWGEAHWLHRYAQRLTWQLGPGPSPRIQFPSEGPYDQRLGYTRLPDFQQRLTRNGFWLTQQARHSPTLSDYLQHGLTPPYPEKGQAGLTLLDARQQIFYQARFPLHQLDAQAPVPPLLATSLLFIEQKDLLEDQYPLSNPAVNWPRFGNALLAQGAKLLGQTVRSSGGSTLATQMEKFRHSPEGRTVCAREKLRQMAAASVKAYRSSVLTLAYREQLLRDYLNAVPLAAAPGYGEVHGIADGLWVWYAADPQQTLAQLAAPADDERQLQAKGLALRQVLSLLIAHRRPSFYLLSGRQELARLTDSYLRLLGQNGQLTPDLQAAALASQVTFRQFTQAPAYQEVAGNKALFATRGRLSGLLGVSLYELDRLDLTVRSYLDVPLQHQITAYLHALADPAVAAQLGLYGERLLSPEKTGQVRYSFTLYERTPDGFLVRVQTDNTDQPFDINESSKLELGSTAKLRVLTTYLQIISEQYQSMSGMTATQLRQLRLDPLDVISRWCQDYLLRHPQDSLEQILEAALERRYSASPYENFFTGGGLHRFSNFRKEDNNRRPTLRQALRESINLPFIRLLRDLVRYTLAQDPTRRALLENDQDPRREQYLQRFADKEGTVYLQRFWRKYRGQDQVTRLTTLLQGSHLSATKLAVIYRYLYPRADEAALGAFIEQWLPGKVTPKQLDGLFRRYGPDAFSLPDQGYLARIHPLELWLLGYLMQHPDATFSQVVADSHEQRLEVYGWLFRSRHKGARDRRIRILLENEAFSDIHQRWQQLGYPFGHLVPSLATAIGSSGDRPAALAQLIGIILNDGVRLPVHRLASLDFAADTPYESHFATPDAQPQRVLPAAVAHALRGALTQVVEAGTARRIAGTFTQADGTPLQMGGKTGTGDNRIETVGRYGQVLSSKAINRTATFVFYLGERHFGTLTAFVEGSKADNFRFTSALPVQVLKGMAPLLKPYLSAEPPGAPPREETAAPSPVPTP